MHFSCEGEKWTPGVRARTHGLVGFRGPMGRGTNYRAGPSRDTDRRCGLRPASPSFANSKFSVGRAGPLHAPEHARAFVRRQFEVVDDGLDNLPRELILDEGSGRGVSINRDDSWCHASFQGDLTALDAGDQDAQFAHGDTQVIDVLIVEARPTTSVGRCEPWKAQELRRPGKLDSDLGRPFQRLHLRSIRPDVSPLGPAGILDRTPWRRRGSFASRAGFESEATRGRF